VVELSDVTSSQVQIEPLDGHLQINGDMVKAHAEVGQLAAELQVQITGQAPEIPLDLKPSKSLAPEQNLEPSSFPSSRSLGPGRDHITTILSLFSPLPTSISPTRRKEMPLPVLFKGRERKRKAVVINDDPVHTVDGDKDGDAKVAQKRPVKKQKSESADAKPRTKRAKDPSRKKKEMRVEETTKVACIDEPIRENMFPLRTRAKQHDDEVGSSANASLQLPQSQLPLPRVEVPSPPPRPPQAKPMLPHPCHAPACGARSERVEYASRAACAYCADGSSGIHLSAPT